MTTFDLLKLLEEQAERWRHVALDNGEVALRAVTLAVKKAFEDGYLGDLYRTDYTVTGRGAFPVDMLRYTQSWPADEGQVGQLERSHEGDVEASDPFTIRLTKYHRDPKPVLAEDRWQSKFHWHVMANTVETVAL